MTTAYTSLLGLALPVTGELSGTWGDVVNNSITSLLDSAIAGTTTISADADVTFSTTTGAANQAREAILLWTAGGTATRTITAPAQSKIYTVINASSSTQSIKLVGAGPTTGVTIVKGESAVCAWNGSDFIKVSNAGGSSSFVDLTVSGGLTLSGGTANGIAYLNGSKVVTTGSALTFDGTYLYSGGLRLRGLDTANTIYQPTGAFNITSQDSYIGIKTLADVPLIFSVNSTEGMRLTSTGLGIGTSSPAFKLDVAGTFRNTGIARLGTGVTTTLANIGDDGTVNTRIIQFSRAAAVTDIVNIQGINAGVGAADIALQASGGNVGIGTTSPSSIFNIKTSNGQFLVQNGTSAAQMRISAFNNAGNANAALIFEGYSSEYGRFDTSGNLLVGTTSSSPTNGNWLTSLPASAGAYHAIGHASGTPSGNYFQAFYYNASAIGSITQSGTTAVLYNLTSDQRLKTNIVDAESSSALIDAIQVRQYDWKSDGSHQRYGFIAQELVTVAPEAVHQPADPEEMMGVDYSKLVPMLVKEIQSLRKRLADAGI